MSNDLISRQAVLDLAERGFLVGNHNYKSVCNAINDLPSVIPTQNCVENALGALDCISRQAVIDIIHLFFTEEVDKIPTKKTEDGEVYIIRKCQPLFEMNKAICKRIKALPPVNPQEPIAQERYEDLCEYFGDAKDILKNRDDFKAWLGRVKWHIHKAEELYEKYEKESCEDCVNRREVFEQINCWIGSGEYRCTNATYYLTERVKHISSVNPQEPKWIPVSESLPKVNGWYQCTIQSRDLSRTMELYYKNGKWLDNRRVDMFNTYDIYGYAMSTEKHKLSYEELRPMFDWTIHVIAWKPLSEPYKVESEG